MKPNLVDVSQLKTAEQYATSLALAILSFQSFAAYQHQAYKEGLLDEEQTEQSKSICWELVRIAKMYADHFQSILKNLNLTEDQIIEALQKLQGKEE